MATSVRTGRHGNLFQLGETWGKQYAIAVKSRENNWEDLPPSSTTPLRPPADCNDLLRDLPSEIRYIGCFLGISLSEEAVAAIVPVLNLEAMRRNAEQTLPAPSAL